MRRAWVWGLLYAAIAVVFVQIELRGTPGDATAPVSGDLLSYYFPSLSYGYAELRAGRLPLWSPHQACGAPFIAALHHGYFYPLYLPFLLLDAADAITLHIALHLALGGLGMFLLGRHVGMRAAAAFLAGIVYAYSGAVMLTVYFPDFLTSSTWIPYQFLLVDRLLTRPTWRATGALALVLGVSFLGGHGVQFVYFTVVALLPLIVVRGTLAAAGEGAALLRRAVTALAVAAVLGTLIGLVRILPMAEYLADSWRPRDVTAYARIMAMPPATFRTGLLTPEPSPPRSPFAPDAPDLLRHVYVGLVPLALALVGLLAWRPRAVSLPIALAGVGAVLYAFGERGPVYPVLMRLPMGTWFQGLDRSLVIFAFAGAFLAGAGADVVLDTRGPDLGMRGRVGRGALAAIALLIVVGLSLAYGAPRGHAAAVDYGAAAALLIGGALVVPRPAVQAACAALLTGLVLIELFHAQEHGGALPAQASDYLSRNDAVYAAIGARGGLARTYIWSTYEPGPLYFRSETAKAGLSHGLWMATDYDPTCSRRFAAYLDRIGSPFAYPLGFTPFHPTPDNVRLIELMGIEYFVVERSQEERVLAGLPALRERWRPLWQDERVTVYDDPDAMPRAFIAERVEVEPDADRILDRIAAADLRQVAFVEAPLISALSDGASPADAGHMDAEIVSYEANKVVLDTRAGRAGLLVLTDQYGAGWRATIDGAPAELIRADYLFRGVPVPSGRHRVELTYRPASFAIGAAGSITGLVATLILLAGRGSARRRQRSLREPLAQC